MNAIRLTLRLLPPALLAQLWVACSKPHDPVRPASLPSATVRVQKIESVKQPAVEEVVGTVRPRLQAVIEAKVAGRVAQLPVTLGQTVRRGDLLVELDAREVQARLNQAQAAFRQAEIDSQRFARLRDQGALTPAEFDAAQTRLEVAKAVTAEAEALLAYVRILAPFEGVVARKFADVGDLALPGKPLLELEGRTGLRLEADVPAALVSRVPVGAALAVRVDSRPAGLRGTVSEVSPAVDPATRTMRIKVDLPDAEGLQAGQFARLDVPGDDAESLFLPPAALVRRGQLEIVFVAAEGHAQLRLVRVGKPTASGLEILSGLTPGEAVVVEGAQGLRDGQPLTMK